MNYTGDMTSIVHRPSPPLSRYVDTLWYWEGIPATHRLERLMPDGAQNLVINLHRDCLKAYEPENPARFRIQRGAIFTGARSGFEVIDAECQQRIVGVHFRPGGGWPFLGMPADSLGCYEVELADLPGGLHRNLREQLLEAVEPSAIVRRLEAHLLSLLRIESHSAVRHAIDRLSRVPDVAAVAAETGYSMRRFIRLFRREVGLTPKTFARVRRFQRVVRLLHGRQDVNWVDVALHCGYYDQAHFIHDFRNFSGFTPGTFLATPREHLNHVPLLD